MAALTLARAYQHSFDTRPNVTLAITGGSLNALGDCVAQIAENTFSSSTKERRKYDFVRTVRFFAYGATISPFLGRWNAFLETRFPLHRVSRTVRQRPNAAGGLVRPSQGPPSVSYVALAKRVATDQLIMAPTGLVLFIGSMGMMEGRTRSQIKQKYKDLFGDAILANWKVWPLAQYVNFRYMPLPYRVPFSQACGVLWTLYLSLLNSREDKKQDARVADNKRVIYETEVPYEQHTTHKGTKHVV